MWSHKFMSVARAACLSALVLVPLSGCGFRPLYGGVVGDIRRLELSQITVTPVDNRISHGLRNALLDRLTPNGEPPFPQYRLDFELIEQREGVAIQEDASVTRFNYRLNVTYELYDLGVGGSYPQGCCQNHCSIQCCRK